MKKKVYFYSAYERIWHWTQALAVLLLALTGFEITFSRHFPVTGFRIAVYVHNVIGLAVAGNAFLALFYNMAGGLLKRYIPRAEDFFSLGFRHAGYYLHGIFRGDPHPFEKTPEKRLLPLQKITYFMILNILLPLMIVTGLLKWSARFDPAIPAMFGGLKVLAPIHLFGAWLFVAFVIIHVYMTTTGRTPMSSIFAMITGYEIMDEPGEERSHAAEK